jgi:hypothetical protein
VDGLGEGMKRYKYAGQNAGGGDVSLCLGLCFMFWSALRNLQVQKYLLAWYKSTDTDAEARTKVQILKLAPVTGERGQGAQGRGYQGHGASARGFSSEERFWEVCLLTYADVC